MERSDRMEVNSRVNGTLDVVSGLLNVALLASFVRFNACQMVGKLTCRAWQRQQPCR